MDSTAGGQGLWVSRDMTRRRCLVSRAPVLRPSPCLFDKLDVERWARVVALLSRQPRTGPHWLFRGETRPAQQGVFKQLTRKTQHPPSSEAHSVRRLMTVLSKPCLASGWAFLPKLIRFAVPRSFCLTRGLRARFRFNRGGSRPRVSSDRVRWHRTVRPGPCRHRCTRRE